VKKLLLSFVALSAIALSSLAQGIIVNLSVVGLDPNCGMPTITAYYYSNTDSIDQGNVTFGMMGAIGVYGATIPAASESVNLYVCVMPSPNCGSTTCVDQPIYANTTNSIVITMGAMSDADLDGYTSDIDCNDNDPYVNPSMPEVCGDFMDNNCDGIMDEGCGGSDDLDNDGFMSMFDCNDNDPSINPNAMEICSDSIDNNCNIMIDEGCNGGFTDADMDGFDSSVDCNDFDYMVNPMMAEICADFIDNNCNGVVDEEGCTGGSTGGCNPNIIMYTDSVLYAANPGTVWILNMIDPNTMFTYLWDFGDGNTSTDPFPTNIYELSGTYTVCLTVIDPSGCTGLTCLTFTVTPEGGFIPGGMPMTGFTLNVVGAIPNNVAESVQRANLEVYPNPVNTQSMVRWEGMPAGNGRIDIIAMDGRVVFTTNLNQLGGKQQFNLPTEMLSTGLFNARISAANGFSKSIQMVK
jgi:hypothetical protein